MGTKAKLSIKVLSFFLSVLMAFSCFSIALPHFAPRALAATDDQWDALTDALLAAYNGGYFALNGAHGYAIATSADGGTVGVTDNTMNGYIYNIVRAIGEIIEAETNAEGNELDHNSLLADHIVDTAGARYQNLNGTALNEYQISFIRSVIPQGADPTGETSYWNNSRAHGKVNVDPAYLDNYAASYTFKITAARTAESAIISDYASAYDVPEDGMVETGYELTITAQRMAQANAENASNYDIYYHNASASRSIGTTATDISAVTAYLDFVNETVYARDFAAYSADSTAIYNLLYDTVQTRINGYEPLREALNADGLQNIVETFITQVAVDEYDAYDAALRSARAAISLRPYVNWIKGENITYLEDGEAKPYLNKRNYNESDYHRLVLLKAQAETFYGYISAADSSVHDILEDNYGYSDAEYTDYIAQMTRYIDLCRLTALGDAVRFLMNNVGETYTFAADGPYGYLAPATDTELDPEQTYFTVDNSQTRTVITLVAEPVADDLATYYTAAPMSYFSVGSRSYSSEDYLLAGEECPVSYEDLIKDIALFSTAINYINSSAYAEDAARVFHTSDVSALYNALLAEKNYREFDGEGDSPNADQQAFGNELRWFVEERLGGQITYKSDAELIEYITANPTNTEGYPVSAQDHYDVLLAKFNILKVGKDAATVQRYQNFIADCKTLVVDAAYKEIADRLYDRAHTLHDEAGQGITAANASLIKAGVTNLKAIITTNDDGVITNVTCELADYINDHRSEFNTRVGTTRMNAVMSEASACFNGIKGNGTDGWLAQASAQLSHERVWNTFNSYTNRKLNGSYNRLNGNYGIRAVRADDIARVTGEDYAVSKAKVLTLVSHLDAFLANENFTKLIGGYNDEQNITNLNEYIKDVLNKKVFSDSMVNTLIGLIFPTLTELLGGLFGNLFNPEKSVIKGTGLLSSPSISGATGALDLTQLNIANITINNGKLNVWINGTTYSGGPSTKTVRQILEALGLYIYPISLYNVLNGSVSGIGGFSAAQKTKYSTFMTDLYNAGENWAYFNTRNQYDALTGEEREGYNDTKEDDDGNQVPNVDGKDFQPYVWDVHEFSGFADVMGKFFNAAIEILRPIFTNGTLMKDVTNLGAAYATNFSAKFWVEELVNAHEWDWVLPETINGSISSLKAGLSLEGKDGNKGLQITGTRGYDNVWVPIMEALGLTGYHSGYSTGSYTLNAPFSSNLGTSGNSCTGPELVYGLFYPLLALIEKVAAAPITQVCNLLPNLAYNIAYGCITPLLNALELNIHIYLNLTNVDMANPDLSGDNAWQSIVSVLGEGIISLFHDPIVNALVDYVRGLDILDMAHFNPLNLGSMLDIEDMLGFDLTNLNGIAGFVLDALGADVDLPAINAARLGQLGDKELRTGSSRSQNFNANDDTTYDGNLVTLGAGKYYYVVADVADVFYDLITFVLQFISVEGALSKIIAAIGGKGLGADIDAILAGVDNENAFAALVELFIPAGTTSDMQAYKMASYDWYIPASRAAAFNMAASSKIYQNISAANFVYLKENDWTRKKAETFYNDLENTLTDILQQFVPSLFENAGVDNVSEWLNKTINSMFANNGIDGVIMRGLVKFGDYLAGNSMITNMIHDQIDMSGFKLGTDILMWYKTYGYLADMIPESVPGLAKPAYSVDTYGIPNNATEINKELKNTANTGAQTITEEQLAELQEIEEDATGILVLPDKGNKNTYYKYIVGSYDVENGEWERLRLIPYAPGESYASLSSTNGVTISSAAKNSAKYTDLFADRIQMENATYTQVGRNATYDAENDYYTYNGKSFVAYSGTSLDANTTYYIRTVEEGAYTWKVKVTNATIAQYCNANVNDWITFADGCEYARAQFTAVFAALFEPLAPIISLLLSADDLELFGGALTIKGYDCYNGALIPLMETLQVTGLKTQAQYKADYGIAGSSSADAARTRAANGFYYLTNMLFDKVSEILTIEYDADHEIVGKTPLQKLIDIMPQLFYFVQSNGLSTLVDNLLKPVFVLVDTLRPIVDVDLNDLAGHLLCKLLGYEYSENEAPMTAITKLVVGMIGGFTPAGGGIDNDEGVNALMAINLTNLNLLQIKNIVQGMTGIDLAPLVYAFEGMCEGQRVRVEGVYRNYGVMKAGLSIGENGQVLQTSYTGVEGFCSMNYYGPDTLTVTLAALLDLLMYGDNAAAIDELLGLVAEQTPEQQIIGSTEVAGLVEGLKAIFGETQEAAAKEPDWDYLIYRDGHAAINVVTGVPIEYTPDDNRWENLAEWVNSDLRQYHSLPALYFLVTDWDYDTAKATSQLFSTVLDFLTTAVLREQKDLVAVDDKDSVETFSDFVDYLIATKVTSASTVMSIVELIAQLYNLVPASMIELIGTVLDVDLNHWITQHVVIFGEHEVEDTDAEPDEQGNYPMKSVEEYYANEAYKWFDENDPEYVHDMPTFKAALSQLLTPAAQLLAFIFLESDYRLFKSIKDGVLYAEDAEDATDQIILNGLNAYERGLVPIFEAIKGDALGDEYKTDAFLADGHTAGETGNKYKYDGVKFVNGLLDIVIDLVDDVKANPVTWILERLPGIIYFINANGISVCVENILNSVQTVIETVNTMLDDSSRLKVDNLAGLDLSNLTMAGLLKLVTQFTGIYFREDIVKYLNEFYMGKLRVFDSVNGKTAFTMDLYDDESTSEDDQAENRANFITILITLLVEVLLDEGVYQDPENGYVDTEYSNPAAIDALIGQEGLIAQIAEALKNPESVVYQNINWDYFMPEFDMSDGNCLLDPLDIDGEQRVLGVPAWTFQYLNYATNWTYAKAATTAAGLEDIIIGVLQLIDSDAYGDMESLGELDLLNVDVLFTGETLSKLITAIQGGLFEGGLQIGGIALTEDMINFVGQLLSADLLSWKGIGFSDGPATGTVTDDEHELPYLNYLDKQTADEEIDATKTYYYDKTTYTQFTGSAFEADTTYYVKNGAKYEKTSDNAPQSGKIYYTASTAYVGETGAAIGEFDEDITYYERGEGITYVVSGREDFIKGLGIILKPAEKLLGWLLFGDDYTFFNGSTPVSQNDVLITLPGSDGYSTGLVLLLEALGCKGLKLASSYYDAAEHKYNTSLFIQDLVTSLTDRIDEILSDPVNEIVSLIPELIYFINAGGLQTTVANLLAGPLTLVNSLTSIIGSDSIDASVIDGLLTDVIDGLLEENIPNHKMKETSSFSNDYFRTEDEEPAAGKTYYVFDDEADAFVEFTGSAFEADTGYYEYGPFFTAGVQYFTYDAEAEKYVAAEGRSPESGVQYYTPVHPIPQFSLENLNLLYVFQVVEALTDLEINGVIEGGWLSEEAQATLGIKHSIQYFKMGDVFRYTSMGGVGKMAYKVAFSDEEDFADFITIMFSFLLDIILYEKDGESVNKDAIGALIGSLLGDSGNAEQITSIVEAVISFLSKGFTVEVQDINWLYFDPARNIYSEQAVYKKFTGAAFEDGETYYELADDAYVATADAEPQEGKTYYVANGTKLVRNDVQITPETRFTLPVRTINYLTYASDWSEDLVRYVYRERKTLIAQVVGLLGDSAENELIEGTGLTLKKLLSPTGVDSFSIDDLGIYKAATLNSIRALVADHSTFTGDEFEEGTDYFELVTDGTNQTYVKTEDTEPQEGKTYYTEGLVAKIPQVFRDLLNIILDLDFSRYSDPTATGYIDEFTEAEIEGASESAPGNGGATAPRQAFVNGLCELLSPLDTILDWLFFGENTELTYFDKNTYDEGYHVILRIAGANGYEYGLVPILEALGINPPAATADTTTSSILPDVVDALVTWLDGVLADPIDSILALIPNLLYFINANGLSASVANLLAAPMGIINELSADTSVTELLEGFGVDLGVENLDIMHLDLAAVISIVESLLSVKDDPETAENEAVKFEIITGEGEGEFLTYEKIKNFFFGAIRLGVSANGKVKGTMIYTNEEDEADMLTLIINFAVELILHGENAKALEKALKLDEGTITGILSAIEALGTKTLPGEYHWNYFNEDADHLYSEPDEQGNVHEITDTTTGLVDGVYVAPKTPFDNYLTYKSDWTREISQGLYDNLGPTIDAILTFIAGDDDEAAHTLGELITGSFNLYSAKWLQMIMNLLNGEGFEDGKTYYEKVYEAFEGDAFEEGVTYFEKDGDAYVPTADTEIDAEKTYYVEKLDRFVDGLLDQIGSLLNIIGLLLHCDLSTWATLEFDYAEDADGNVTTDSITNRAQFMAGLKLILEPVYPLLDWLLFGRNYEFFVDAATGNLGAEDTTLIKLAGSEGFAYGLMPILDALGVKFGSENHPLIVGEMSCATDLEAILNGLFDKVDAIMANPVDQLLGMLANLLYFINANGLATAVSNLLGSIVSAANMLMDMGVLKIEAKDDDGNPILDPETGDKTYVTGATIFDFIYDAAGIDVGNLDLEGIFSILETKVDALGGLKFNEVFTDFWDDTGVETNILEKFYVGYGAGVNSTNVFVRNADNSLTEYVTYHIIPVGTNTERVDVLDSKVLSGDILTILLSIVLEVVLYEGNEGPIANIIKGAVGDIYTEFTGDAFEADTTYYVKNDEDEYVEAEEFVEGTTYYTKSEFTEEDFVLLKALLTSGAQAGEYVNPNWVYFRGITNAAELKAAILAVIEDPATNVLPAPIERTVNYLKYEHTTPVSSLNLWSEAFAQSLINDELDATVDQILQLVMKDNEMTLSKLISDNLALFTTETGTKLVEMISGALEGLDEMGINGLIDTLGALLGANNLSAALHDMTFNPIEDGDYEAFAAELARILTPLNKILGFILFGGEYNFFTHLRDTDDADAGEPAMITLKGGEGYKYGLAPILYALGVDTKTGIRDLADPNYASSLSAAQREQVLAANIQAILTNTCKRIDELLYGGAVIDNVLRLLPNLIYFINANGLGASVQNLLNPIDSLLNEVGKAIGKAEGEFTVNGFVKDIDLYNLDFNTIFELVQANTDIVLSDEEGAPIGSYLTKFYFGKLTAGTSFGDRVNFTMGYSDTEQKHDMVTILLELILDVATYEGNAQFIQNLIDPDDPDNAEKIYEMIKALLYNPDGYTKRFPMVPYNWIFTQYAVGEGGDEAGKIITPLNVNGDEGTALLDGSLYGPLYTQAMGAYMTKYLQLLIDTYITLLGIEDGNGGTYRNLDDILNNLIGENIYKRSLLETIANAIAGALEGLKEQVGDELFEKLVSILNTALDVDLNKLINAEIPADFVEGDQESFIHAICTMLSPAAPILRWLLTSQDIALFSTQYGTDYVIIRGADGDQNAGSPIREARLGGRAGGENSILTQAEYEAQAMRPENATDEQKAAADTAMLELIMKPIFDRVDEILADPLVEIFAELPAVIYFIQSKGLDSAFKNLLNPIFELLMVLEPALKNVDLGDGKRLYLTDEETGELVPDANGNAQPDLYGLIGIDLAEFDMEAIVDLLLNMVNENIDTGDLDLSEVIREALPDLVLGQVLGFTSKRQVPADSPNAQAGATGVDYAHDYTMGYAGTSAESGSQIDLVTIVLKVLLSFISQPGNVQVLEGFLKDKLNENGYKFVCSLLENFSQMAATKDGQDKIMYTVYYIFYAALSAGVATNNGLANFNYNYSFLNQLFATSDVAFIRQLEVSFGDLLNKWTGDVVDEDEVVPNGFIKFFQAIINFFKKIGNFFKGLFGG